MSIVRDNVTAPVVAAHSLVSPDELKQLKRFSDLRTRLDEANNEAAILEACIERAVQNAGTDYYLNDSGLHRQCLARIEEMSRERDEILAECLTLQAGSVQAEALIARLARVPDFAQEDGRYVIKVREISGERQIHVFYSCYADPFGPGHAHTVINLQGQLLFHRDLGEPHGTPSKRDRNKCQLKNGCWRRCMSAGDQLAA